MSTNGSAATATSADLNLALQAGIQADLLRTLDRSAGMLQSNYDYNARVRDALAARAGVPPSADPQNGNDPMDIRVNSPTTINQYPQPQPAPGANAQPASPQPTASTPSEANALSAAKAGMGWIGKAAIALAVLGSGGLGAGGVALYNTYFAGKPPAQAAAPVAEKAAAYILDIKPWSGPE